MKEENLRFYSLKRIELSEQIREDLAPILNEIHNEDYSVSFWKFVLSKYINLVITQKSYLDKEITKKKPKYFIDYGFLYSNFKQKILSEIKYIYKGVISRRNNNYNRKLLLNANDLSVAFTSHDAIQELGLPLKEYYPFRRFRSGDTRKREKVIEISQRHENVYFKNIILLLPKVLVEHFTKLYNSIEVHNANLKIFHVYQTRTFYNHLLIAKYVDQGSKLIWYQTGAYYGEYRYHNGHYFKTRTGNEFRTYGWKMFENDVPWKAYRMEAFKKNYLKNNVNKEFDLLVAFGGINSKNLEANKNFSNQLFDNLCPDKFKRILARPRPRNKIISHAYQLNFIKDPRVIKGTGLTSMAEDMQKCNLVLQTSVPSTNFMECIYVNHPTVGILQNPDPSEIIKPYYDFLIRVGVLHNTWESLIIHVNNIDINKWWSEVSSLKEFIEYKNEFVKEV